MRFFPTLALLAGLALPLVLAGAGASQAAQTVHLKLTIKGAAVKGEVTTAGHVDEIEVDAVDHHVFWPVDQSTGALTGKRQHRPVKITKRVDGTSPILMKALTGNELVDLAEFHFFRPAAGGLQEHFYTIKLENGRISRITNLSPDILDPAQATLPVRETVSITYQKITWTYVPSGGAEHTDTWEEPPQ